jgi:hypothetical protein
MPGKKLGRRDRSGRLVRPAVGQEITAYFRDGFGTKTLVEWHRGTAFFHDGYSLLWNSWVGFLLWQP